MARWVVRETFRSWSGRFALSSALVAIAVVASPARSGTVVGLVTHGAPTASPSPGPTSFYATERLDNGGGELGLGSDMEHVVKPSGWGTSGNFTVVEYGSRGDLPVHDNSAHVLNTDSLGKNFFAGGPKSDISIAWQNVRLDPIESDIGENPRGTSKVRFVIGAWLGGRLSSPDYAQVFVRFFGDRQNEGGTKRCGLPYEPEAPCAVLGPVSREERQDLSVLKPLSCWESVPSGSHSAKISLIATRVSGYDNDAFFDNVSFILYGPHQTIPKRVPKCRSSAANAFRAAHVLSFGKRSFQCLWWSFGGVKLMLAFVFASIVLIGMPIVVLWWIRAAASLGAGAVGWFAAQIALHMETVFHAGDTGCILDQSWATPTIGFALLAGYIVFGMVYVFARTRHFKVRWKNKLLFVDAFLVAFVVALGAIGHFSPKSDELERLDTALFVVALGMTYMMIAIPAEIEKFPRALKWGLFALLLAPIVQPATAAWNLHQIKAERVVHENQHRFFRIPGHSKAGGVRFQDVLFFTPTSLDYGASAQIDFRAHLVAPGTTTGCITPRLVAPGFLLRDVLVDPMQIPASKAPARGVPVADSYPESTAAPTENVHWAWIATALQSGRQYAFMHVFLSPKCRSFAKAGDSEPAFGTDAAAVASRATDGNPTRNAFTPVFDETDSVWVARQFIALDDFAGALPWLTLLFTMIAVVIAAFDLRSKRLAEETVPRSESNVPPQAVPPPAPDPPERGPIFYDAYGRPTTPPR